MAKKMNLNGVKDFLFNHGEKVALGTCGVLALLFGITGVWDALSAGKSESGKPWTAEMDEKHSQIMNSIKNYPSQQLPPEKVLMLKPERYEWAMVKTDYQPQAYINVGESADTKRQNPRVLPIRSGPKGTRLEYVPALVYTHELVLDRAAVKILEPAAGGNAGPAGQPPRGKGPAAPGAAADGNTHFMKAGDPRRMIIGHAVFPMKDQVIEFQRALKMASQKEMFDAPREDLPTPHCFDLYKIEVLPNGEPAQKVPEVLLSWDPAARTQFISPKLKNFLSLAMFDVRDAAALEPYIYNGLTMPLPQLAFGNYPPVNLDGGIQSVFEDDAKDPGPNMNKKGPGGPGPKMPGMGLPGIGKKEGGAKPPMAGDKDGQKADANFTESRIGRKDLQAGGEAEQALDKRLFEKDFNIFHALGLKPNPAGGAAAGANLQPPSGPGRGIGGAGAAQGERFFSAWGNGPSEVAPDAKQGEGKKLGFKGGPMPGGAEPPAAAAAFPNWDRDAVVRFIDVDVEPGKSYRYAIRIWLKNPNKGKTDKVAFAALAQPDELPPSAVVETETITIPRDYHLYAIDQLQVEGKSAPSAEAKIKDATTFQIHQWMKTPPASEDQIIAYPIGDWVIAERVLVHKGDRIGPGAFVQSPYWDGRSDAFKAPTKKYPGHGNKQGMKIDMEPPVGDKAAENGIVGNDGYPLLIDFIGGKRKVAPNSTVDEDVAVDALIVGADGKLRVLNSRDAADTSTDAGKERQERVQRAADRVNEISGSTSSTGPGSQKKGNLPGMPNNNN